MAATARREGPPTRWKDNAVTSMGDMRRHNEIYPDLNNVLMSRDQESRLETLQVKGSAHTFGDSNPIERPLAAPEWGWLTSRIARTYKPLGFEQIKVRRYLFDEHATLQF